MVEFLSNNFSHCVFLAVFLLALCPMLESKVAIPFALSSVIWGDATLSPIATFFVALFGSMLPAIFIVLLSRLFRRKTTGFVHEKFTSHFEKRYKKNVTQIDGKTNVFRKCLCLGTFVAVPLPLTGVYTGSLIAGFTNLKIWQCFVSVFLGEVVSCAVVLLLCLLFENSAFYMFIASLILVAVFILFNVVIWLVKKAIYLAHKNSSNL